MKANVKKCVSKLPSVLFASLVVGLGMPAILLANSMHAAFKEQRFPDAMNRMAGNAAINLSEKIQIRTPKLAENSSEVRIDVHANLNNVEQISIFAEGNPNPLLASFKVQPGASVNIGTRVKLSKTQNIIALVKADGKYYKAQQEVKITKGGC